MSTLGGVLMLFLRVRGQKKDRVPAEEPEGVEIYNGSLAVARKTVEKLADQGVCAWVDIDPNDATQGTVMVMSEDELTALNEEGSETVESLVETMKRNGEAVRRCLVLRFRQIPDRRLRKS